MSDYTFTFATDDFTLNWEFNPKNTTFPGVTLDEYLVEVWTADEATLKASYTVTPDVEYGGTFTYTKAQNTSDFGSLTRSFFIKLYSVDNSANKSLYTSALVSNPVPAEPTIVVTPGDPGKYHVSITPPADIDVAGYLINASTTTGFIPSGANEISDSTSLSQLISGLTPGDVWYIRCAAYDSYGQTGLNYCPEQATVIASSEIPDQTGNNGKFLKTNGSNMSWSTLDFPVTTKGDIFVFGTTVDRLPVGANGKVLSADSTEALGLKWIDQYSYTLPVATASVLGGVKIGTGLSMTGGSSDVLTTSYGTTSTTACVGNDTRISTMPIYLGMYVAAGNAKKISAVPALFSFRVPTNLGSPTSAVDTYTSSGTEVYTLYKNTTSIGTLTLGTSSLTVSVTQTDFAAGDVLKLVSPASSSNVGIFQLAFLAIIL